MGQLIKRRDGDDHRAAGYANLRRGDRRDSARRRAGHRHAQVLGSARHRTDICRARRSVSRQRECDQPDQRTAQLLPQSGFIGSDSLTYQAIDSGGASQPATASITVPPPPPRPVASIVGPARVTVGQPVKYNASVIDSIGTPNAFRWTFAGRRIGSGPTLTHVFAKPGSRGLALHVSDSAGNIIIATLNVTATSPRLKIKLDFHAEFSIPPKDTKFASMIARAVPIGTSIQFVCSGPGCPFAHRGYEVTARTTCHQKRCKKRSTSRPDSRDVDLTSPVNGARLPIGTVLTITFRKPLAIGQVYILTIGAVGPTTRKACIPVGKTRAASRC